jgi:putative colanic acid biosynthesis UDP-glucose lipid carrier transferase
MIVNKKSISVVGALVDFILINAAFIIAIQLSNPTELNIEKSYPYLLNVIINFVWLFYTSSSGYYKEFLIRPFPIQLYNIIKLVIVITITCILFLFIITQHIYARYFIFLLFLIMVTALTIRTIIFKGALRTVRNQGKSIRNLLIIGANEIGERFRDVITKNPEYGHRFVGFVDNTPGKYVIGSLSELDRLLIQENVEDVVIALHNNSHENLDELISICNRNAVKIHVIPDFFKFLSNRFQLSTVSNLPVITIRDEPLNEALRRFVKRVFDLLFSFLIMVFILSWFIPIVSVIIKLDSSGSVFFIQERFGMRRKPFKCIKFRTLYINRKNQTEFEPIVKEDPRVTHIGKFLRKTNLDELPQFINVFVGDMSVVGPRPHPIGVERVYEKVFEEIKMRYNVRPGITGWAQINGLRGEVSNETENKKRILEKMKYDLWYIENWSIKLDVEIILLTIWHMIRGDTKGF